MGKAKLGSWWAAGAAVCLLISAGVAAQTAAPPENPVPAPAPPPTAAALAPPLAATVGQPYDVRGGGDERILTELHRRNQQVIADAELAQQRAASAAVRDYATAVLNARAADDARIVNYARRAGMNLDSIRLGAGAMANGSLTRIDLMNSSGARFDYDFATKMVSANQATLDQTQKGQALARAPGMAELMRQLAPTMMEQQAQGMALLARIPTPPPTDLQLPGQPAAVSRTHTGVDTRPGVAP